MPHWRSRWLSVHGSCSVNACGPRLGRCWRVRATCGRASQMSRERLAEHEARVNRPLARWGGSELEEQLAMTASDMWRAEARGNDFFTRPLADADPEIFGAIEHELERQQNEIELIASENIVSKAVLEAAGTLLTNKYAEGYPGRRYYGGCQYVDVVEQLAIDRAKRLFNCAFANVQPHSGSQANQSVMLALLKPGDTIMGLSLAAGGHLTHGAPPNLSGKWFNAVQYGVRPDDP